jgi:hypothetical protein
LIFASTRQERFGSRQVHTWNDQPFLNLYKGVIAKDGSVGEIMPFDESTNTQFHESNMVISTDGSELYFTRNNFHEGRKVLSEEGVNNLEIFMRRQTGQGWSKEIPFPYNSISHSVGHPALSAQHHFPRRENPAEIREEDKQAPRLRRAAREIGRGELRHAVQLLSQQLRKSLLHPASPPAEADGIPFTPVEQIWSAFDCAQLWALIAHAGNGPIDRVVTAKLAGRLHAPVVAGEEHVLYAWVAGRTESSLLAGSALVGADGELRATGLQTAVKADWGVPLRP